MRSHKIPTQLLISNYKLKTVQFKNIVEKALTDEYNFSEITKGSKRGFLFPKK
jgi:hypothetical protein